MRDRHKEAPMRRGIGYALASALLFGMSTPLAKSLIGDVSPLLLAGLLYAGSGLGLLLLLVGRGFVAARAFPVVLPRRGEWRWLGGAIVHGAAGMVPVSRELRSPHRRRNARYRCGRSAARRGAGRRAQCLARYGVDRCCMPLLGAG